MTHRVCLDITILVLDWSPFHGRWVVQDSRFIAADPDKRYRQDSHWLGVLSRRS